MCAQLGGVKAKCTGPVLKDRKQTRYFGYRKQSPMGRVAGLMSTEVGVVKVGWIYRFCSCTGKGYPGGPRDKEQQKGNVSRFRFPGGL